jgi:hypothetical protein
VAAVITTQIKEGSVLVLTDSGEQEVEQVFKVLGVNPTGSQLVLEDAEGQSTHW